MGVRSTDRRHGVVETTLWPDRAVLPLSDQASAAELDRSAGRIELDLAAPHDHETLLHPFLSTSLAIFNWWHGRDVMHAGAFVNDGVAWGILGQRGRGKSTMLAHLALEGVPVLCDDVVVEIDGDVVPGPQFIDLRADAGEQLRAGRGLGVVGGRARHRLDIGIRTTPTKLAGWISLDWGDAVESVEEAPARRLQLLLANRGLRLPPTDPEAFLRHAALPMYTIRRPRDWSMLARTAEVLLDLRP